MPEFKVTIKGEYAIKGEILYKNTFWVDSEETALELARDEAYEQAEGALHIDTDKLEILIDD